MIIACIISFIVGAMVIMFALGIVSLCKDKEPRNKVHFYVARNKNGELNVYLNKPLRNKEKGYWYQYNYIINKQNSILIWVSTRITNGMYFKYSLL